MLHAGTSATSCPRRQGPCNGRAARAGAAAGHPADFRIGDLAAAGLDAGSADAVLCVDAIHFATQPDAAYREIRRILTSGGRAVLTNWEPLEWDDQRLPGRLRRVDLGDGTDRGRVLGRRGPRPPRLAGLRARHVAGSRSARPR